MIDNCDVFYRNQTHLGKKSKLSWLLIMKVEIFSFVMTKLSYFSFTKTQNRDCPLKLQV